MKIDNQTGAGAGPAAARIDKPAAARTGGQPLISVILPAYNRAETIPAALESVLNQTYPSLEVIVVDDGSTDGTEALFSALPEDPRITYFRYEPNRGACHARNVGAAQAKGTYIAFQDSDDLWTPDKLEKEMAFLISEDADLVFCGMNRTSRNGGTYYFPVHPFQNDKDPTAQFLLENRAGTQTLLMRKNVWETVRFDETFRRYQDWDFMLRAAAAGTKIRYLAEPLASSQVRADSISASVSSIPALEHLHDAHRAEFRAHPRAELKYRARIRKRRRSEKQIHNEKQKGR